MMILFIDLLSTLPPNNTKELNAIVNSRRLYKSCINVDTFSTDDINTILTIIDGELGGWPILQGIAWNNSTFNFMQLLLKLNSYNTYPIFTASSQPDDRNSSKMSLLVRSNSFIITINNRVQHFRLDRVILV